MRVWLRHGLACVLGFGLMATGRAAKAAPLYCADHGIRTLHVAMYPFIPNVGDAAWRIAQAFEAGCPGLSLKITLNPDYYGTHGVLTEQADVYEVDSIFAQDVAARHKAQPIPASLDHDLGESFPFAEAISRPQGVRLGVPHWLCTNFLFLRKDLGAPPDTRDALARWFRAKAPQDRLLLDLAGPENLGEMDVSVLLARWGSAPAALAHLNDPAAQADVTQALRTLLSAEVPDTGRDPRFDLATGLYARLMARKQGGAYVGYSESLYTVLDETANGCRPDACVIADDIAVARMPFGRSGAPVVGWADMFMIDAGARGRTLRDATAFVRFMMQPATFRMILVPTDGTPPRYLLPATKALYSDPAMLKAAPLYAQLAPIIATAQAPSAVGLEAALQHAAVGVDRALGRE